MIILNVTYKCKPDMRAEFLEAIYTEGIDIACRAEDGNTVGQITADLQKGTP